MQKKNRSVMATSMTMKQLKIDAETSPFYMAKDVSRDLDIIDVIPLPPKLRAAMVDKENYNSMSMTMSSKSALTSLLSP